MSRGRGERGRAQKTLAVAGVLNPLLNIYGVSFFAAHRYGAKDFTFDRVALTKVDTAKLPSWFEAKSKDPRHGWYRKLYGDKAWELDAMDPGELRQRVASYIEKYIDIDAWKRHKIIEEAQRTTTKMVAAQLAEMGTEWILEDYSLDDLHIIATAEMGDDSAAAKLLHDLYADMTREYAAWLRALRERERVQ